MANRAGADGAQIITPDFFATLKTITLGAIGAFSTYIIIAGRVADYIDTRFTWLAYLGALLFLALASALAVLGISGRQGAASLSWRAFLIIIAPLALALVIPARDTTESVFDRSISVNADESGPQVVFSADPRQWDVLDWLRELNASADPARYDGQEVDVAGYAYREAGFAQNVFRLAHDSNSTAVGLSVLWQGDPAVPTDTWVRVQGRFVLAPDGSLTLRPITVESIDAPDTPHAHG